jgi:methane monooxygenase PmoA-like
MRRKARVILLLVAAWGCFAAAWAAGGGKVFTGERTESFVLLKAPNGSPVLRYLYGKLPGGEKGPSVEGTCYTHPLSTPSGEVVTDLAPADHPHHRGVFCAWVKVEGENIGDWWGWGALAPKERRLIQNKDVRVLDQGEKLGILRALNSWQAEGAVVLEEQVTIRAGQSPNCNVVDYEYRFSAPTRKPVVIAQNPFGGFCYRARPRGKLEISAPEGKMDRPDAIFNKAETNWPVSRWYDFTYTTPEGKVNGAAVMDHPKNPRSTWHIVRGIHMLNPCIVADGPVTIRPGEPLVLRYRLVAHDGAAASADLERLFTDFANSK